MNADLTKQALEKVGNPHVLVNVISRRVRQLNGGGGPSRPMVDAPPWAGLADIALMELLEGKIGWDLNQADLEFHDSRITHKIEAA